MTQSGLLLAAHAMADTPHSRLGLAEHAAFLPIARSPRNFRASSGESVFLYLYAARSVVAVVFFCDHAAQAVAGVELAGLIVLVLQIALRVVGDAHHRRARRVADAGEAVRAGSVDIIAAIHALSVFQAVGVRVKLNPQQGLLEDFAVFAAYTAGRLAPPIDAVYSLLRIDL